jgi:hypothetical protein
VALSSFAVHTMLVTHTTWVKRFLNGSTAVVSAAAPAETTAAAAAAPLVAAPKKP